MKMTRCAWVKHIEEEKYHDEEWGVPSYDDKHLYEMLILEGFQAGLSWYTILKKRENFRKAFAGFDYHKIAKFSDEQLEALMSNEGIIRNRLKIFGTRKNAIAFMKVQKEFGSFSTYLWGFVAGKPIINSCPSLKDVPASTELSDKISKDMKKRGFTFVGTTIIYAYMQAVGIVNDHTNDCKFKKK
ncbi:MAG: DNA-3-methyladenine glycosylase I [Alphaproteobacteria bacterium]|nr:DNA-3-methyladenine glycosylase I [Alphaproteobacteria bacterium]